MPAKSKAKPQAKKVTSIAPLKERAVKAALDLASRMGWDMVTLMDIADESHATLAELCDVFEDKGDILNSYGRMLDRKTLERFGEVDPSMPERDRLFDVMMERFDVLNEDRAAIISILKSFTTDPKEAVIALPHLGRSMAWMLEAAGMDTNGMRGAIKIAGLTGVYFYALKAWMDDEGADLPKTMAALDRGLSRAEQAANTFML